RSLPARPRLAAGRGGDRAGPVARAERGVLAAVPGSGPGDRAAVGADRRVEPVPAPRSVARSAVPAAVDHLRAGTGRPGGGTADADRRDRRPGPAGSGHGPGPAPEGRWLGPGPDHGDRTAGPGRLLPGPGAGGDGRGGPGDAGPALVGGAGSPGGVLRGSGLLRGADPTYRGVGPGLADLGMGLVFGEWYRRTRRTLPLVVAHTLVDVFAFVGYALRQNLITT